MDKYNNIPNELKGIKAWLLWKYETVNGRDTKIPYRVTGERASATNINHCSSYYEVLDKVNNYSGIGISLDATDIIAIDIDHCIDSSGRMSPKVVEVVRYFGTYTEISPSGRGLRILCRGRWDTNKCRTRISEEVGLEVYRTKRYVTMTGNKLVYGKSSINYCQFGLDWLREKFFKKRNKVVKKIQPKLKCLSDDQVIDKVLQGDNGRAFYDLFYRGNGFADKSKCDFILCCILGKMTTDIDQIERIFNRSKLVRPKWVNREDYRVRTITNAIEVNSHGRI